MSSKQTKVQRRSFLKGSLAAGAGAAAATALAAPAIAQNKRELSMVMAWPHNFPGLASIAYNWAQYISDVTDGELTAKVHAAGELVGTMEIFDAVGQGTADCYHGPSVFLAGKWAGANFFSAIPFGLTPAEHCAWMYHGGGQALQQEIYRELFSIVSFTCGQTGQQMAGWFNKEIKNLDDFRGITMRATGIAGEVMRRVGGAAQMIPPQEIFQALQAGTIDAAELCCAWLDSANGFQQHAKYYYTPGWQEPNSAGEIGINADVFDSLPKKHQLVVERAAQAANAVNIGEWPYYNAQFMNKLITENNVDVRIYPDDVIQAIAKAAVEVVAEVGNTDDNSKRIYASWKEYRDKAVEYSVKVEAPFYQARRIAYEAGI